MSIEVAQDPNKDPIRRLTNQQLWDNLLNGMVSDFAIGAIERELERRLRRVAFLPALPLKEDA